MNNNIENKAPRSTFFPGDRKNLATNSRPNNIKETLLETNDLLKKNELDNTTAGDAKVTIPDSIRDFSRIKKAVDAAPPIDNTEKIARLKDQIKNGDYKIDYDALADKILSSEF